MTTKDIHRGSTYDVDFVQYSLMQAMAQLPISRVDTDVELEVAYSCNIFDVSDSLTCPDIQSS